MDITRGRLREVLTKHGIAENQAGAVLNELDRLETAEQINEMAKQKRSETSGLTAEQKKKNTEELIKSMGYKNREVADDENN